MPDQNDDYYVLRLKGGREFNVPRSATKEQISAIIASLPPELTGPEKPPGPIDAAEAAVTQGIDKLRNTGKMEKIPFTDVDIPFKRFIPNMNPMIADGLDAAKNMAFHPIDNGPTVGALLATGATGVASGGMSLLPSLIAAYAGGAAGSLAKDNYGSEAQLKPVDTNTQFENAMLNGGKESLLQLAGHGVLKIPSALNKASDWTMRAALGGSARAAMENKAPRAALDAMDKLVAHMRKQGYTVDRGGLIAADEAAEAGERAAEEAVQPQFVRTNQVDVINATEPHVTAYRDSLARQGGQEPGAAVDAAYDEWLTGDMLKSGTLTPAEAVDMKRGLYQRIGDNFGENTNKYKTETWKKIAFGLKDAAEKDSVKDLAGINAKFGADITARDAIMDRLVQSDMGAMHGIPSTYLTATHPGMSMAHIAMKGGGGIPKVLSHTSLKADAAMGTLNDLFQVGPKRVLEPAITNLPRAAVAEFTSEPGMSEDEIAWRKWQLGRKGVK